MTKVLSLLQPLTCQFGLLSACHFGFFLSFPAFVDFVISLLKYFPFSFFVLEDFVFSFATFSTFSCFVFVDFVSSPEPKAHKVSL